MVIVKLNTLFILYNDTHTLYLDASTHVSVASDTSCAPLNLLALLADVLPTFTSNCFSNSIIPTCTLNINNNYCNVGYLMPDSLFIHAIYTGNIKQENLYNFSDTNLLNTQTKATVHV